MLFRSVPFSQTREYIQIVLRNADIYRRIYGSQPAADPPVAAKPAVAATAAAPAKSQTVTESPGRLSYSHGVDQRKKSSRPTGAR